jgi:hypothetical protein
MKYLLNWVDANFFSPFSEHFSQCDKFQMILNREKSTNNNVRWVSAGYNPPPKNKCEKSHWNMQLLISKDPLAFANKKTLTGYCATSKYTRYFVLVHYKKW